MHYSRKFTTKTIISILLPIMVVLLLWNFKLYYHPESKKPNFRCPETYTTDAEYTDGLRSYLNEEVTNNPHITAEELTKKRYEALVANNCTTTLQNLVDRLPEGSGATKDDIIKNVLKSFNITE